MSYDTSIPFTISENATALNMADYMARIDNFLVNTAGFTKIDDRANDPNINDNYKVFQSGDLFFHFQSYFRPGYTEIEGGVYLNVSKIYDNTKDFFQQQNNNVAELSRDDPDFRNTSQIIFLQTGGVPQYFLFWNGRNLVMINEYTNGKYVSAMMGRSESYNQSLDHYFCMSDLNGFVDSISTIDSVFKSNLYNNNEYGFFLIDGNIIDDSDIAFDSGSFIVPVFTFGNGASNLAENSFISNDFKGMLWSPSLFRKSSEYDGSFYSAGIKFSDTFIVWNDWFNTLDEYFVGAKKYKYFPLYQKTVPANSSDLGGGRGIVLRIE